MVRTPFFPKPLLPVIVMSTNFLLYLFALPVLAVLLWMGGIQVSRAAAALPAIWLVEAVLTLAITMLVAACAIVVRDVQHLLGVIMTLWFYLTPVFY